MRKINTLLSENNQLSAIAQNVQSRAAINHLWQISVPKILAQSSHVTSLDSGQLKILADSAIIANKIKLTQVSLLSSLLTQLQNLQKNEPSFGVCKVTSISVKVQVKSTVKPVIKAPRIISAKAAASLKTLARDLGESPLAQKLNLLANKR
jgi:hypothetical protein